MKSLLVIDVGNTNVKYGLFTNGELTDSWRHPTSDAAVASADALARTDAKIAISSVVPVASEIIKKFAGDRLFVEVTAAGQKVLADMSPEMGADRVADAVAAWKIYGKGRKPVIVAGFGTATTLLAVSAAGAVVGGWIAPGLSMTLESLHHRCALLPLLKMEEQTTQLGFDTNTHMRNGVFVGHIGLMREWLTTARRQLGGRPVTVGTGGWSKAIQEASGSRRLFQHVDPNLTLKGIYLIATQDNVAQEE